MKNKFVNTILLIEKIFRYGLFIANILLFLFIIFYISLFAPSIETIYGSTASIKAIAIYKVYRNLFYVIYTLYFPFVLSKGIMEASQNKFHELLKTGIQSVGLVLFITFSYTLARACIDIGLVFIIFNMKILETQGIK